MRQTLGPSGWRATQSAPWLLAPVSLLQGAAESSVCFSCEQTGSFTKKIF